jgi:hypothetical protein
VFRLAQNSSITLVFFVCYFSSSLTRSEDVYMYALIDLSSLSNLSWILDMCMRVVDDAFLSDKINYLFSVMPLCIS